MLCYGLQHLVQPVEDEADAVFEDVVVKGIRVVRRFVVVEGNAGSEHDGGDAVLQENALVTKKVCRIRNNYYLCQRNISGRYYHQSGIHP